MNLVLGYVLLVAYYGIFTVPDASGKARFSSTIIASLPETAVSYQTGLRRGMRSSKSTANTPSPIPTSS